MASDILFDFFCKPIVDYSGYNLVNTLVYAVILLAVAFLIVVPWLKRSQLLLNHRFLFSLLPFILLGSSFRILEDLRLVQRSCNPFSPWFYTITPGIYIATGILTIAALWLSLQIGKKDSNKTLRFFGAIGTVLAIPVLVFLLLRFKVWNGFFGVLALALALLLVARFGTKAWKKTRPILESQLNQLVFLGQMLDASATFTAIQFYHCAEEHVLSGGIINAFGPFAFVIVKFALMLLVLYYADKEVEDAKTRDFIKILIAIIGFAPGIRDALTLAVGTCL